MRDYDTTPAGVTYFRINAIGFGVSLLAMFVAMYWWMGMQTPELYGEPIVLGIFAITALFTAGLYLVPAAVPRRAWGYVVAWIQIAFSLTSMTATLPSLAVIIAFAREEVRDWFDGKPVGFRGGSRAHGAVVTALIGYYALVSVAPFGIAYLLRPDQHGDEAIEEVAGAEHHVTFDRHFLMEEDELGPPERWTATRLANHAEWKLEEQSGPVAVTVWATYCGACSSQFDEIADAPRLIGERTKHVTLALDCEKDGRDHRAHVRKKLGRSGITSEALCATEDGGLGVNKLPTTVYFDTDGRRRATAVGFQSYETLDRIADAVERSESNR